MKYKKIIIMLMLMLSSIVSVNAVGTAPNPDNTLAYYMLENTSIIDETPNGNDGTNNGPTSGAGILNNGLIFDGDTSDYMSTPFKPPKGANPFSISMWVYANAAAQYGFYTTMQPSPDRDGIFIQRLADGSLYVATYQSDSAQGLINSAPGTIAPTTWYYVTVTYNGAKLEAFVDGSSVGSDATATFATHDYDGNFGEVYQSSSGNELSGKLDEIAFFNYTLSQDEIDYLYNSGTPTSDQQWDFSGGAPSPAINITNVTTDEKGEYVANQTFNTSSINWNVESNVTGGGSEDVNMSYNAFMLNESIKTGLVAYYTFNDKTSDDNSGNGNNGTDVGGVTYDVGLYGNTAEFDGINQYISTSGITDSSTQSISLWIKTDVISYPSTNTFKILNTGKTYIGFRDNRIRFGTSSSSTSSIILNSSYSNWVFITGIYDGTNTNIYYNGILMDSDTHALASTTGVSGEIGATHTSSRYFNGSIDEVMIFNRSLNITEITEIYTNSYQQFATDNVNGSFELQNLIEADYVSQIVAQNNVSATVLEILFSVDLIDPVITNNIAAEINSYTFTPNASCSDTNLLSCNISIDGQNVELNGSSITVTHNGNLSYTITAIDESGRTTINTSTILVNPIQYFYFTLENGTQLTNFTFGGVSYDNVANISTYNDIISLGNNSLLFEKLGVSSVLINFTLTNTSSINLTTNVTQSVITLIIYDRETNTVLTGLTEITLIATTGGSGNTTTGYLNISNINFINEEYQIIATHSGYLTETIYFTYNNQENLNKEIYLLPSNSSEAGTINLQVETSGAEFVEGAICVAAEWDSDISGFRSVAEGLTNINGITTLNIELNIKSYKFTCSKSGVSSSTESQIIQSTETTIPIILDVSIGVRPDDTFGGITGSLTNVSLNDTHQLITFNWFDVYNLDNTGQLAVYRVRGTTKTLIGTAQQSSSNPGELFVIVDINQSYRIQVEGSIIDTGNGEIVLGTILYLPSSDISVSLSEYGLDLLVPILFIIIGIAIGLSLQPQNIYISAIAVIGMVWLSVAIVPSVISTTVALFVTAISSIILWGKR